MKTSDDQRIFRLLVSYLLHSPAEIQEHADKLKKVTTVIMSTTAAIVYLLKMTR